MARIGVLLSGCGVQDGSEISEAVLTLLALERAGAEIHAMAPDVDQAEVINHYSGAEVRTGEIIGSPTRSVLAESARIVRGKIISTNEVSSHDIDGLIIVGGYGAVKNLCTYALDGENAQINGDVARIIQELNGLGKPIGAMCAASVVVAIALREKAPTLTIGNDGSMALGITRLGGHHAETGVGDTFVDRKNRIVSTPAFMLANSALEAEPGITKLVEQVLELVQENLA